MTAVAELPQAELTVDEALDLAPIAHKRMIGSEAFIFVYQAVGALGGMFLGSLLAGLIPIALALAHTAVPLWLPLGFLPILGGIWGWAIAIRRAHQHHRTKFIAGIRQRGTPDSVTAHYAVEDAGFRVTTRRVDYLIAWDAVLEIIPTPEVWLLQIDTTSFLLPKRAFADDVAERAFLADILARIPPEARERSAEALAFAG